MKLLWDLHFQFVFVTDVNGFKYQLAYVQLCTHYGLQNMFVTNVNGFKYQLVYVQLCTYYPSAFSSPLILRGYQPLIDLVRNAMPSLTFGPSRRDSARSIIVGRGFFSCPPEKCGGFFSERFGFSSTLIRLGILIFTDWIVVSFERSISRGRP